MSHVAPVEPGGNTLSGAAYDVFAPFYDSLTRDADYEWWWSALMPLAEAAGLSGRRALDVACGTGKSLAPLLEAGWSAVGVDISAPMLDLARRKLGPDVPLLQRDMCDLPVLGVFDLICSLNDSVNYLLEQEQLVAAFKGFRRNLAPGGVVLFDVNTIGMYRVYGALVRQEPSRVLIVEGIADGEVEPGGVFRTDFVVLEQREGFFWTIERSPHFQRHHPDADIRAAMLEAGLEFVGAHGQTYKTITPTVDEDTDEKVVYVARAPTDGRR
ncbi:methyltransferase domain-containing protein [Baekduia sp. Peel2402]|uniref:methyltransferase domain-containing protein n=1 Tax=Baekduia sp. Peel2402 TaxID=3458296 RepID=UPI00403E3C6F